MADKESCFVIMPITTPEKLVNNYNNDEDHFLHILDCIFIPAIEAAEFNPIRPITEGTENIHANIIKNVETADLVLCDLSIFNPNVFFELGIRTALNKPVCLVKDEQTKDLPFDVGSINCHTYNSTLKSWHLETEIDVLKNHILKSKANSKGENPLWKYYGIANIAKPVEIKGGVENKLDLLTYKVDHLFTKINTKIPNPTTNISNVRRFDNMYDAIESLLSNDYKVGLKKIEILEDQSPNLEITIRIDVDSYLTLKSRRYLEQLALSFGYTVAEFIMPVYKGG